MKDIINNATLVMYKRLWQNQVTTPTQKEFRIYLFKFPFKNTIISKCSSLMPRLHMLVWQPGTERKTCIKVYLCCRGHGI